MAVPQEPVKAGDRVIMRGSVRFVGPDGGVLPGIAEVIADDCEPEGMGTCWIRLESLQREPVTMQVTDVRDDHS